MSSHNSMGTAGKSTRKMFVGMQRRRRPKWSTVLLDVLLTAVVLVTSRTSYLADGKTFPNYLLIIAFSEGKKKPATVLASN